MKGEKKKAICLSPKPLPTKRYSIHESSGQFYTWAKAIREMQTNEFMHTLFE